MNRSNVPGYKKLAAGDRFVYYRPGEHVIFGGGIIEDIETKQTPSGREDGGLTEYYAHIEDYRTTDPPLQVRDIKDQISFLKNRDGLRGVPQNSIYEIDRDDFATIVEAAEMTTLLPNL